MSFKVGLFGFGKTGSLVAKEIVSDNDLSLQWVCRKNLPKDLAYSSHALGLDHKFAPFITPAQLNAEYLKNNPVDFIIDFSSGQTTQLYQVISDCGVRIISAISEYTQDEFNLLKNASKKVPVLYSPNITVGINWLLIVSKILKKIIPHSDIEIVEEHFRDKSKVSGTALKLAEHLDIDAQKHVNSIRVGGIVGTHQVIFGLPHQTIRLTHESISRSAFGTGAIFGAKWLMNKEAGMYKMENVFHEKFLKHLNTLDL